MIVLLCDDSDSMMDSEDELVTEGETSPAAILAQVKL